MQNEQRERLVEALALAGKALRRALHRKKEVQAFFEAAAAALRAAQEVGPLGPTLWRSLDAQEVWLDELGLYYEDAVRLRRFELAERVTWIFEALAPDEGAVERIRVEALGRDRPEACSLLEEAVKDPARDPWARNLALGYLAELSREAFARAAPDALRLVLATGNEHDAADLADTLNNALCTTAPGGFGAFQESRWLN